jgi:hypothetical protein
VERIPVYREDEFLNIKYALEKRQGQYSKLPGISSRKIPQYILKKLIFLGLCGGLFPEFFPGYLLDIILLY